MDLIREEIKEYMFKPDIERVSKYNEIIRKINAYSPTPFLKEVEKVEGFPMITLSYLDQMYRLMLHLEEKFGTHV